MITTYLLLRSSVKGQPADNAFRAGEVGKVYRAGERADNHLDNVAICERTIRKRISAIERDSIYRGW